MCWVILTICLTVSNYVGIIQFVGLNNFNFAGTIQLLRSFVEIIMHSFVCSGTLFGSVDKPNQPLSTTNTTSSPLFYNHYYELS